MIKLTNITKIYKKKRKEIAALDNVNFTFEDNKFYSVIGPSGSGKSTLLNIISTLDYPTDGTLEIDGSKINFADTNSCDTLRKNNFSIVYEDFNLFEKETLRYNLEISCESYSIIYPEDKALDLMKQLNLKSTLLDQQIRFLSGGEKKRACILRALLLNKKIIIMDEPTAGLDYDTAKAIFEILNSIKKDRIIIICTHDKKFAQKYSDCILEIRQGKLTNTTYNDQTEDTVSITNFHPEQSNTKNKHLRKISNSIWKSNALLYVLVFVFSILFSNGIDMSLSCTKDEISAEKMQQSIDKVDGAYYSTFNFNKKDEEYALNTINNNFRKDSTFKVYGITTNQTRYFVNSNDFDDFSSDLFILDGSYPKANDEIAVTSNVINDFIGLDEFNNSDILNKYYLFSFNDGPSKLDIRLKITGIVEPISKDYHEYLICSNDLFSKLQQANYISSTPYFYYLDLKKGNFISLINYLETVGEDDERIRFYPIDNGLLNYYYGGYIYTKDGILILAISEIVISGIFLALFIYMIISKNKDSISMFRALGVRKKEALKLYSTNTCLISILGTICSIPISVFLISLMSEKGLYGENYGLHFSLYSYNGWCVIITLLIINFLICGLIYLFINHLYKTKKLVKM